MSLSQVSVRTYQPSDHAKVVQLFRDSQHELVMASMKSKLFAPATWVVWIGVYAILFSMVSHPWLAGLLWTLFVLVGIYIGSAFIEIQDRVDEALANDLKDPAHYYLKEDRPSHFWVLTLNDEVCGMIGLSCNDKDVEDQRETLPIVWKQFCAAILTLLQMPVPDYLKKGRPCTNDYDDKKRIFGYLQIPKTATMTRWVVRSDCRARGFSTLLVKKVMTWAQDHDINRVYAMTNESCTNAEHILKKRHGFVLMKQYSLNFFGEYNHLLACRVKAWIDQN